MAISENGKWPNQKTDQVFRIRRRYVRKRPYAGDTLSSLLKRVAAYLTVLRTRCFVTTVGRKNSVEMI